MGRIAHVLSSKIHPMREETRLIPSEMLTTFSSVAGVWYVAIREQPAWETMMREETRLIPGEMLSTFSSVAGVWYVAIREQPPWETMMLIRGFGALGLLV